MNKQANLTSIKQARQSFKETFLSSNLACFEAHRGFRPGEVHTIVGPRGGGKSTTAKTIISDALSFDKKTLILLSEEKPEKYLVPIYNSLLLAGKTEEEISNYLENQVKVISELDFEHLDGKFWKQIEYEIDNYGPDIFIYDNFTTGFMAALPNERQYKAMLYIRSMAERKNIPVLVFLHTDKKTRSNERAMSSEDVKGLATIVNLGSYNYVIQPMIIDGIRVTFLIIDKARYHSEADKTIWELRYHSAAGIFVKSDKIKHEDFKELFSKKGGKK